MCNNFFGMDNCWIIIGIIILLLICGGDDCGRCDRGDRGCC